MKELILTILMMVTIMGCETPAPRLIYDYRSVPHNWYDHDYSCPSDTAECFHPDRSNRVIQKQILDDLGDNLTSNTIR